MRKSMFTILAGLAAILVPVAANAKSYPSPSAQNYSWSTSLTNGGEQASQGKKSSYAKKSGYSKKSAKRSGGTHKASTTQKRRYASRSSGGSGASGSCLTFAARALLGKIRSRFGNVQIISTCRPGARIATTGKVSRHASGNAIDFRVPGRKREVVQWLITNHKSGGTMTYSDMDHIHVDVGYHFVALNRPSGH